MRQPITKGLTFGLVTTAALLFAVQSASARELSLEGTWKLVVLSYGEDEFLVIDVSEEDGNFAGEVKDAQRFLRGAVVDNVELDGDDVTLVVGGPGPASVFVGRVIDEGESAGHVLGTFEFRGSSHPARLEPTEEDKVGRLQGEAVQKLREVAVMPEAQQRVEALKELLAATPGPSNHLFYSELLKSAEEAGLTADAVQGHVKDWLAAAEVYGEQWKANCRARALKALADSKPYAAVSLSLANEALAELGEDASAAQQASVLAAVVSAARLANATDLAESAAARLEEIEAKLDAEYLDSVPPFEPEKFAGRENAAHDRVVLLELFTGAECPPCVAADVAFDGLLKTYQPTELVVLQYHLHIPGPDPLTNEDSIARSRYYTLRGTPSLYFNGSASPPAGGGMSAAEATYGRLRESIDEQLAESAVAEIDLKVTRSGSKIIIQATAQAEIVAAAADEDADADDNGDDAEDDADTAKPDLRLRLALTEESIRYVGGNALRFHHHVVRALPGGVEGKVLEDGRTEIELTINTDEIRDQLQGYVDGYERGFPRSTPEIELQDLSVVAFLQNDADKNVLHAVTSAVPEE